MSQHYRKTGASFSEALGAAPGGAVTADRLIHAIDGLRKAQDEDKTGSKGVVSALKEPEKLDVFLARGCGETQVELCPGVYGKELFHGIKRAGHHAKHMLQLIRWPVLISNRLALAIAGLWWGGEESYTLLASDCATAKAEQVEAWTPPTEHKIESRARAPAAFLTWLRYAENAVKVFGSAYGLEHVPERMAFLAALREANEEDENAFPVGYCIKLYEELNAVWCEQIRESRRKLCAKLGTENPRLEDLKLVALSPGPDGAPAFQFPRVWDLQDPQGYYQQVILPRQQRAMTRLWNKQLHEQALSSTRRSNKTAGNEETTDPGDAADPKAGKGPNLRLKRNDREEVPSGPTAEGPTDKSGEPPRKAYPAGRRLTPQEVTRSVKHAPVDPKSGKPICWDAACHIGCNRSSCPNAHEPLPALGKLDPTVAMQVLRRGGLRGEKKIDPKDVDGRVAQLRSQMKEEQASKQADGKGDKPGKPKGKAKASGKAKAGWQLPEDYSGPLTVMEKELSEIGLGPDLAWHEAYRPGLTVDTTPVDDPRAAQRIEVYKQLKAAGTLDPIVNCGPHLYCHVVSRLVNAHEAQEQVSVADVLTHAIDHGHPQLAQEAQTCFDQNGYKAGRQSDHPAPEALLVPDQEPHEEGQPLRGSLRVSEALYPKGLALPYEDHQDRLVVSSGAPPLFPKAELDELRQCLCLHVGRVFAEDASSTLAMATSLRSELWEEASAAQGHLGDAPPMITEAEAFVRHNTHDCLAPHHEKDYRVLQLFASKFMAGRALVVFRVSSTGHLEVDLGVTCVPSLSPPLVCRN